MTAFARGAGATKWGELTCELRSVNHRYLEISPRLAEEVRYLEPRLRELISSRLKRGRVDCTIRLQTQDAAANQMDIDLGVVTRLVAAAGEVSSHCPEISGLRMVDVLRWPGVLKTEELDSDQLGAATLDIVRLTLDELCATREREGGRLGEILGRRLDQIAEIVERVQRDLPSICAEFRERLVNRLGEVRNELDPARLEQEIVLYIQKADVTEEVDRLAVHVDEVRQVLAHSEPIGRRLDFLMQELNRESNTLGSKSVDSRLTQAAVELKVLVDQMREQVQNIE